jgi:hypothetical protein
MAENLNAIFSQIDTAIKKADFQGAIKELLFLKPTIEKYFDEIKNIDVINDDDSKANYVLITILNYGGFLIDCAGVVRDENLLDEGIYFTKNLFSRVTKENKFYSNIAYNLANGLEEKIKIKQHNSNHHYWIGDKNTEESKRLYRNILDQISTDDVLVLPLLTNYANLLNGRLGRVLESLNYYDKALSINSKFSMALANKGYVQTLFASVLSGEASSIFTHEAYINIKHALKIGLDEGPKIYFNSIQEQIKNLFPEIENLGENIECKNILKDADDSFKSFYKVFCNENNLYLNPISNNHKCEAALYDPLTIKRMMIKKSEVDNKFYKIVGNFNQIKQEFVLARYLAAQSFFQDIELNFVDDGVVILDTLDYSVFNIYIEQAKTSFRISYSLLDKIAFVFNQYLNLGLKENAIYFYKLSPLFSDSIIKKLSPLQNPYISAILDLANDFNNGYYQKLAELRNAFEHRFKSIHIYSIPRRVTNDDKNLDASEMLTAVEFRKLLIDLLKIVKAAIFYLVLMIDWEERINESNNKTILFPMYIHEVKDELKIE